MELKSPNTSIPTKTLENGASKEQMIHETRISGWIYFPKCFEFTRKVRWSLGIKILLRRRNMLLNFTLATMRKPRVTGDLASEKPLVATSPWMFSVKPLRVIIRCWKIWKHERDMQKLRKKYEKNTI